MTNRLSHSSTSLYQECGKKWEFHYRDRLRTNIQSAALIFGSAVDAALTSLIKKEDKNPNEVFEHAWRFADVNGKNIHVPTATCIAYSNSDFDLELLHKEDLVKLQQEYGLEDPVKEIDKLYAEKDYSGFANMPEERKKLFNHYNWLCLYRKGLLMIQAVKDKVLPNVEEVLGVQEFVELKNADGDSVIGYADLICRWKGKEHPVVLDWKTSSIEYKEDSVLTSPQLTLYVHALHEKFQTRSAGFIVLHKQIKKNKTKRCLKCDKDGTGQRHKTCDAGINGDRCNGEWGVTLDPEVYVQIIIDEIPQQTEDIVMENIDFINQAIKNGVFTRNFQSCVRPWGKCAFYSKCFKGSDDGLVKLEEKK